LVQPNHSIGWCETTAATIPANMSLGGETTRNETLLRNSSNSSTCHGPATFDGSHYETLDVARLSESGQLQDLCGKS
jgi:hypothetical protein